MEKIDIAVVGGGAAGLFCAAQLGQRGSQVALFDNGKKLGRKILMSGGGRCNFTNLYTEATAYLSQNPHFCKSALARYTQWHFIELVQRYGIAYHEKTLGQLFCDDSAKQIVQLLAQECQKGQVSIRLRTQIDAIERYGGGFLLQTSQGEILVNKLVIASGGLSMPELGATPFGYQLAEQFMIPVVTTRAALVPLTLHKPLLNHLQELAGVSLPIIVQAQNGQQFKENVLFTHRGLSGPAILQISSYWQAGELLQINLLPQLALADLLALQQQHPEQQLKTLLVQYLPKRLVQSLPLLLPFFSMLADKPLKQLTLAQWQQVVTQLQAWQIQPNGTEGYRTAEVTLGGVDTRYLSSKTFESRQIANLYFIGEVVDVTGWLGGYNFQWAWSSAAACASEM